MNKKKIELQVLNVTSSQEQAGAFSMVMGEVNGPRKLSVIIGAAEAQAIIIEMKGIIPPRPLTHNLFASVLEVLGVALMRVLIYRAENNVFYTYLYMKADETMLRIDSRTSDAVALAIRMSAPIYIYEDILEAERMKTDDEEDLTLEDGTYPAGNPNKEKVLENLRAELRKAIEEENYERAAQLRDIINQQQQDSL